MGSVECGKWCVMVAEPAPSVTTAERSELIRVFHFLPLLPADVGLRKPFPFFLPLSLFFVCTRAKMSLLLDSHPSVEPIHLWLSKGKATQLAPGTLACYLQVPVFFHRKLTGDQTTSSRCVPERLESKRLTAIVGDSRVASFLVPPTVSLVRHPT